MRTELGTLEGRMTTVPGASVCGARLFLRTDHDGVVQLELGDFDNKFQHGRRAVVTGRIHYNEKDRPKKIDEVTAVEILPLQLTTGGKLTINELPPLFPNPPMVEWDQRQNRLLERSKKRWGEAAMQRFISGPVRGFPSSKVDIGYIYDAIRNYYAMNRIITREGLEEVIKRDLPLAVQEVSWILLDFADGALQVRFTTTDDYSGYTYEFWVPLDRGA